MKLLVLFVNKLSILLRSRRFRSELDEEMAFHRAEMEKEMIAGGTTPEKARYVAMRQFGNIEKLREQSHEAVVFRGETVAQDLRFALRQWAKYSGFAFTSILILALGMCASISIFGFVDAALIKPLPYPQPDRLAFVTESAAMFPRANISYPDFLDWRKQNKVFSSLDVFRSEGFLFQTRSGAEPIEAARVSDGFFHTLGITPLLGRDFHKAEGLPEAPNTVMLTYATWQNRFGGRPTVVGESVSLSGVPYTIIAVLPATFQFAPLGGAEFWANLHPVDSCSKRRSCHDLDGIGRLKDGISMDAARAEMKGIARQLELQYPTDNRDQGAFVGPLAEIIVQDVRPILLVLLSGAGLLLLIACVNVSSLLLVRSESRRREIAVRSALGASRLRLIRQFTIEGVVLVVAGLVLGVLAADLSMQLLTRLITKDMMNFMPYLAGLGLNFHVSIFAILISVLSTVLFSITPLMRLPLSHIKEGLGESDRGYAGTVWRRFGANLVAAELAIAVVLLVGAGLLGKSFYRLLRVDIGFEPDHLATVQLAVSDTAYPKNEQEEELGRKIIDRVSRLPGVISAGLTSKLPVSENGNTWWIRVVGHPFNGEHNEVNYREVSSAFFTTLHAKLLRGRYFNEADDASKPRVLIINEALAKKYFPGEDPLGQKIGNNTLTPDSIAEVIGIVSDVRDGSLDSEVWPAIYEPVRTSQSAGSILPALVAAVHEGDPGIGTKDEATMRGKINSSPTAYIHRSAAWLVGAFAALALLLGVVGLYGVIAYSVSRRTREIGVRMALGAQRGSVYSLVMREAGWLTGIGLAIGLLSSVGASLLIRNLLFGVRAWDEVTLGAVTVLLGLSSMAASFLPARRAASVNPTDALRAE
jgi:predicted permease